jgi:ABC-type multidrug transport system fused ATPase/permease subunit
MSLPKIYAGKRRSLLWQLVANGVAQAFCGVALAYLLRETLASGAGQGTPWLGAAGIASLGILILFLRIREASDAERLGQNYVTRVRLRIFDRLASRPARGPGGGRWGLTMTRLISDLNSLRNWVSTGIARAIVASITAMGLLVGLALMSPWSALGVSAMLLACGLASAGITPRLRALIRESRRRRGRLANNLGEKILALPTVRQLGRAAKERARVRSHSVRLSNALVRRVAMGSALRSLPDVTMPLAIAGIAIAASMSPRVAHESVVAVLLLGMIAASLRDLARAWDHRLAFEEGHRRIGQILTGARIREERKAIEIPGEGPIAVEFAGIGVDGVFEKLDFRIDAGEQILLEGPSGSGKSTVLAMAARMFDADSGEIRLGGAPIRSLRLDSLRAAVQLVSPAMPLLRGTVGDNIGYGLVDSDPQWVEQVIAICGLNEASGSLPEGLATRVEEQGRNLPEGLRARVALARASVLAPRLLLVDDPTFSTDPIATQALEQIRMLAPVTSLVVGVGSVDPDRYDRVWSLSADEHSPARGGSQCP